MLRDSSSISEVIDILKMSANIDQLSILAGSAERIEYGLSTLSRTTLAANLSGSESPAHLQSCGQEWWGDRNQKSKPQRN